MVFVLKNNMRRYILLKLLFCIFLCTLSTTVFSQDLEVVDVRIKNYPTTRFNTPEELSDRIAADFQSDLERVRAIYTWITENIAYSYEAQNTMSFSYTSEEDRIRKQEIYREQLAKVTLRSKRAVCHGYSILFKKLCDNLNIKCEIVRGFGKSFVSDIASEFQSNHAWNKVTVDGQEYLIDATWGAGGMNGDRFERDVTYVYFFTPPEIFIKNHYPRNYADALLDKRISIKEFILNPIYYEDGMDTYFLRQPSIGVLQKDGINSFEIQSKIPIQKMQYYTNGKFYEIPNVRKEGDLYIFDLDMAGNSGRELILYANYNAIFGFKVRP